MNNILKLTKDPDQLTDQEKKELLLNTFKKFTDDIGEENDWAKLLVMEEFLKILLEKK